MGVSEFLLLTLVNTGVSEVTGSFQCW
jgi:hypothetical protein